MQQTTETRVATRTATIALVIGIVALAAAAFFGIRNATLRQPVTTKTITEEEAVALQYKKLYQVYPRESKTGKEFCSMIGAECTIVLITNTEEKLYRSAEPSDLISNKDDAFVLCESRTPIEKPDVTAYEKYVKEDFEDYIDENYGEEGLPLDKWIVRKSTKEELVPGKMTAVNRPKNDDLRELELEHDDSVYAGRYPWQAIEHYIYKYWPWWAVEHYLYK